MASLLERSANTAGIVVPAPDSLIMPIRIGDETKAVTLASGLRERGVFVPAIRYPSVARGTARLRVTLTAAHSADDVAALVHALNGIVNLKS